jgi:teichoic acid transport system permease protein
MLVSGEYPSWYWLLLIPAVLLQTMFNTGAALIVARLGGSLADVSELIPFFLRISRYFCGVMYLIITLPAALSNWEKQVLSLNPFAVFISLIRVAFMSTYRANSAGNAPYNAGLCKQFLHHQGQLIPGTSTPNYAWQASCHAIVTNNDLWVAAVAWGVAFFAAGIVFFWQAENKYGRG